MITFWIPIDILEGILQVGPGLAMVAHRVRENEKARTRKYDGKKLQVTRSYFHLPITNGSSLQSERLK